MLKTIGYSYSEGRNEYHIAPIMFFNEPRLDHLSWITTLFPSEDAKDNTKKLSQKLGNFIQYYHPEKLLIIGGDISCLQSILEHYPNKANLVINTAITIELPKHIHLGNDLQETILCIDAKNPIPNIIPNANIITIINYDYKQDTHQQVFNQLIDLILSAKVSD